jgi:hypothetical protein
LSWVYDTKIIYLDWESKLKLIKKFMDRFEHYFLPKVSNLQKEQLIPFLKELLTKVVIGTEVIKSRAETKFFN